MSNHLKHATEYKFWSIHASQSNPELVNKTKEIKHKKDIASIIT